MVCRVDARGVNFMKVSLLPLSRFVRGAAVGLALCGITRLMAVQSGIPPESFTVILLCAVFIACPGILACAAALTALVTAAIYLPHELQFGMGRAAIFGVFLFLWGDAVAPVVLLVVIWAILLTVPLALPNTAMPPIEPKTVNGIGFEIAGAVGAWFFGMFTCRNLQLRSRFVTQKQFFIHLLLIPVLALSMLGLIFVLVHGGVNTGDGETVVMSELLERHILLGILGVMLAAMFLSVVFANILLDYTDLFIDANFPDGVPAHSPFPEAESVLAHLRDRAHAFDELHGIIDEMRAGTSLEIPEVADAWRGFRKASEVLAKVADAAFAFTPTGRIVVATPTLTRLLRMPKKSVVGLDRAVFAQGQSPWAADISNWMRWSLENQHDLLHRGARRLWSQPDQGFYLEILIRAWAPKQGRERDSGIGLGTTIAFFLRRLPERRPLQLNMFQPTELEKLGADTPEFILSLVDSVQDTLEHISLLSAKIHNSALLSGRSASNEAGEISQLITETEKVVRRMAGNVEQRRKRLLASTERIEEIDLGATIEATLDHLCDLLGVEFRIPIVNAAGAPLAAGNEFTRTVVKLDHSEFWGVVQYFAGLVHAILPRARDVKVELEPEQIGTSTASVLTGSVPGRYIRLSLSHSGQSINAQILAVQQEGTSIFQAGPPEPLSIALFLLSRQVKRIGGFVSLQSSATKGTGISIYLPADQRQIRPQPSRREMRRLTGTLVAGTTGGTQVLVVGQEGVELEQIARLLERLSFEMVARTPDELLQELASPLEFEGRGFGGREEQIQADAKSEKSRKRLDVSPFRLIIFDTSNADFETLTLLDELERGDPALAKILLHDSGNEDRFRGLAHWVKLAKPLTESLLQDNIRALLTRASSIQESLVLIEGSDSVGGSGFD